jgi:hypothetical protein
MGRGKKFWNDQDISRMTYYIEQKLVSKLTKINFETNLDFVTL